jgi:hypothetical protein
VSQFEFNRPYRVGCARVVSAKAASSGKPNDQERRRNRPSRSALSRPRRKLLVFDEVTGTKSGHAQPGSVQGSVRSGFTGCFVSRWSHLAHTLVMPQRQSSSVSNFGRRCVRHDLNHTEGHGAFDEKFPCRLRRKGDSHRFRIRATLCAGRQARTGWRQASASGFRFG